MTCILKTLVESGEMILSDGRRIVAPDRVRGHRDDPNLIRMHPDFRMVVLANRPGKKKKRKLVIKKVKISQN